MDTAELFFRMALTSFALLSTTHAARYEQHVLFTNAPAAGGYSHSETAVVAPSTLEHSGGLVPVATDRFVSPPNALRLHWKSAQGG
jgi:hypothetical protein